ncbi:MAG: hypothetical protein CM1200mP13_13730 [Candidatus Pelagibacterales bacterium]|nr:MAG: hypothetical protein CM1200mP13_13730 [Pelagibacterales bacterium]
MIKPDKKTKKKNIITAIAILAFMVFFLFLHFITLEYLIGRYDERQNINPKIVRGIFVLMLGFSFAANTFVRFIL